MDFMALLAGFARNGNPSTEKNKMMSGQRVVIGKGDTKASEVVEADLPTYQAFLEAERRFLQKTGLRLIHEGRADFIGRDTRQGASPSPVAGVMPHGQ